MKRTRSDSGDPEEVDTQTLPTPGTDQVTGQEEQAGHTPAPPAKKTKTGWFTPTRIMTLAAAVPSLAALPWAAWAIAHLVPAPIYIGLPVGIVFDLALVGTVGLALTNPRISTQASQAGWVAAIAAAIAIALHTGLGGALLFAVTPLLSKTLWQLIIASHRADEVAHAKEVQEREAAEEEQAKAEEERRRREREAAEEEAQADDSSLTVEQRRTIADLKRQAAFAKAKADAEAERERAQIEAENTVDMATDQAEADRLKARYELAAQVGGRLPIQVLAQFLPDLPGVSTEVTEIHRDRSQINAAPAANGAAEAIPAGFGAGLTEARGGIGGIGVDLGEGAAPQGSNGTGGTGGAANAQPHHAARRASGQATRQRVLAAIEKHGPGISTNELAEKLGLGRTTVRDHRKALAKAGKHVMPDPKK